MSAAARRRPSAALLAALLAVFAGWPSAAAAREDGPSRAAAAGLDAWLRSDAAGAASRFAEAGRDPWARAGAAALARRGLAPDAEADALLALVRDDPDHPLALVALRRLAELADGSPARARRIDAALAERLSTGRLAGLAAYRARAARIAAAEALGDLDRAVALRAEVGAVSAWTLAGPFGRLHALEFDTAFAPERGELPASVPAPAGLPPRASRPLPTPDGLATLEGEPGDGDVFYLASDLALARGGRYLAAVGSTASLKLLVDGAVVAERRAFAAHPPSLQHVALDLEPGPHRVLVKLARGPDAGAALHVAFARADGAPSDATFRAAAPGTAPPARRLPRASPAGGARDLARALAPGGPAGALLAAVDALRTDREAAKALLAEAAAVRPTSGAILEALARATADDPTLDVQAARAAAQSTLRRALEADPSHAAARVTLAAMQRDAERLDDAEETLGKLAQDAAARPAAEVARARVALARGLAERAEALAVHAVAAGGGCDALELAADAAARRDAVAPLDEALRALAACPGGRDRLAARLAQRGDPAAALAALAPAARARPGSIEGAKARARALVAAGDPGRAAAELEAALAIWPRSADLALRLADARELAGDAAAARAARDRALLLRGDDLRLRRALALEDGTEVLAAEAQDARAAIRAYEAAHAAARTSTVLVLDAAAVEIHPGASATERTHQVVHVVDQQGVDRFGEFEVPSGAEVLSVRTLKPDGRSLEPDLTAGGKESLSLAGLEPGDYVDLEWLRAAKGHGHGAPGPYGFAADAFFFQVAGTPLFRSVYAVAAPRGAGLAADAHAMDAPEVRAEGERDVVRAERTRVPAFVPEPGGPGMAELLPFVQVGVGGGREALQLALADAAVERTRPTVELLAYARRVRDEAGKGAGAEALARRAYARVAEDVLGQGGGLGDDASEVLSRRRGSRLVLLKAVLDALGVRARFALARPFAADPAPYRFPGPGRYAAPLLRVEAGDKVLWLDPSLRRMPFGALAAGVLDCEALVLPAPGEAPEVARTPASVVPADARESDVVVTLAPDGGAAVRGTDRFGGQGGAAVKAAIERLDADDRRRMVEGMVSRAFRGFALEHFAIEGEADPDAPLAIRWSGRVAALGRAADGGLRVESALVPLALSARFVQVAARRTPLLVAAGEHEVQRIRVEPPPGLAATAADPAALEGPSGRYARTERVEAGALLREERLDLERARIAPADYPALARFAAAVDALQERPLVLAPRGP